MTVQTILTVTAWVFAVIALSVSICARNKEKENVDWKDSTTNSLLSKVCALEKAREDQRSDYWWLVRRIEVLEKKLAGEGRDACRPRSYVTLGEGDEKILVLLPERKCENEITEKVWWKNQYSELRAKYDVAVEENKKLEKENERLRESIETIARVSGVCGKKKGE